MNRYLQAIDDTAGKLLETVRRFPLALISAFLFVLTMMFEMYSHRLGGDIVQKVSFISFLSFFFFLSLRLMTKSWIVSLLGLLAVGAFYLYIPDSPQEYMGQAEGRVKFPLMIATLFFLMIVSPFLTHKSSNRVFFEWLKHLIYTALLSAVVGLILSIILNFGLDIIKNLFDMKVGYFVDDQIRLFSFAFVSLFLFLSQIPKEPRRMNLVEYNRVETISVKYILSTLYVVYFLIISIYAIKILVLGENLKGVVSWNIIAFSVLAILTYIFWTPLWSDKNQKYKKIIWISILLHLFILATALYLRIEPYGWTINRLLLGSLGAWLLVVSLYGLIKGKISYQIIFVSIPLIIALNLMFDLNISKNSQQERLKELISSSNPLSDESNLSLRYNISSKIDYLYKYHGTDAFLPIMPLVVTEFENQDTAEDIDNCRPILIKSFQDYATQNLGFKYVNKWSWENHIREIKEKQNSIKHYRVIRYPEEMNVSNYDWIVPFNYYKKAKFGTIPICPSVELNTKAKATIFKIRTEGNWFIMEEQQKVIARVNLENFITKILNTKQKDKRVETLPYYVNNFSKEEFTHYYQNEKVRLKLMFESFRFSYDNKLLGYEGEVWLDRR